MPISRSGVLGRAGLLLVLLTVIVGGCMKMHESADYERHRFSQVTEPYDRKDVIYFDVTFSPQFPDDDEVAEQVRIEWLEAWLEQRKMCPNGYEIIERRPFDMLEDNPARHDIRYVFECSSRPAS